VTGKRRFKESESLTRDKEKGKAVRDRLGKIVYGPGCKTCKFNPAVGKIAKRLGMSPTQLGRFLNNEKEFREGTLIKLELWLDTVEEK
jgi:hypothetical protein